jgi:hypothetical protein
MTTTLIMVINDQISVITTLTLTAEQQTAFDIICDAYYKLIDVTMPQIFKAKTYFIIHLLLKALLESIENI